MLVGIAVFACASKERSLEPAIVSPADFPSACGLPSIAQKRTGTWIRSRSGAGGTVVTWYIQLAMIVFPVKSVVKSILTSTPLMSGVVTSVGMTGASETNNPRPASILRWNTTRSDPNSGFARIVPVIVVSLFVAAEYWRGSGTPSPSSTVSGPPVQDVSGSLAGPPWSADAKLGSQSAVT